MQQIMRTAFMFRPFLSILMIYNVNVYSQTCPDWPASCPVDNYIDGDRMEDSMKRMLNPIVSEEVTMEFRLRELTGKLVRRVAAREHWEEPVEIQEGGSSGYRDADENVLAFPLRPPHWIKFSWQIIVDKDSMQLWLDWLKDLGTRAEANVSEYANKMSAAEDRYKSYMDSANYYGDLKGNYMSAHFAKYQQDLQAGNKAGIAAYEKALAVYDDKANVFVKKATDLQKDPGAEKRGDDIQTERVQKSLMFRESVVLFIEFDFNPDLGGPVACDCTPTKGGISPGGFKFVRWFNNPNPAATNFPDYTNSSNLVFGLLGGWSPVPDNKGIYRPSYKMDKKASDKITPKKIKSDEVQSICIYGSGNKSAMQKLIADLATEELNNVIIHN